MTIAKEVDTLSLNGVVIKLTPAIIKFLVGTQYDTTGTEPEDVAGIHAEQLGFTNMFPASFPTLEEGFNVDFG